MSQSNLSQMALLQQWLKNLGCGEKKKKKNLGCGSTI